MARLVCSLAILLTVWCIMSDSASAQLSEAAVGPQTSCPDAQSMPNVNLTQFVGTWYEIARQPAVPSQCVQFNFTSYPNNILNINLTRASNPNQLWTNSSTNVNVTVTAASTAGYNVTWSGEPQMTVKLLDTNYNGYAFICGYTNASDPTTAFGAILVRNRSLDSTTLMGYQSTAASQYTNFSTSNMSYITQSSKCYTPNGASTTVPALATMFAFLFAILKYFN